MNQLKGLIIFLYQNLIEQDHKVALLIITDDEKWHFTSVRSETRLFRGIFLKHHNYYYCLNCRYSYRTENALKKHERLCLNNKDCLVKLKP